MVSEAISHARVLTAVLLAADPERRGRKKPVDKAQAMQELREVVRSSP